MNSNGVHALLRIAFFEISSVDNQLVTDEDFKRIGRQGRNRRGNLPAFRPLNCHQVSVDASSCSQDSNNACHCVEIGLTSCFTSGSPPNFPSKCRSGFSPSLFHERCVPWLSNLTGHVSVLGSLGDAYTLLCSGNFSRSRLKMPIADELLNLRGLSWQPIQLWVAHSGGNFDEDIIDFQNSCRDGALV